MTSEHTTWEVKKYIPEIAAATGKPENELFYAFDHFSIFKTSDMLAMLAHSPVLMR